MDIIAIEGATRVLGKPKDWNDERDGNCLGLPIREEVINGSLPSLTSAWRPTPEELARIVAGAPIHLRVISISHPPVMLEVGAVPA